MLLLKGVRVVRVTRGEQTTQGQHKGTVLLTTFGTQGDGSSVLTNSNIQQGDCVKRTVPVTPPLGVLKKYVPKGNQFFVVSRDIPYDPNHPER